MADSKRNIRTKALIQMLRPVVRYWLRRADRFQEFSELLKIVFVDVAREELTKSHNKVNVSRIHMLTGVHRNDVSRIFKQGAQPKVLPDFLSRLIGQWEQDPEFQTTNGTPRVLTYLGKNNDFSRLVEKVSKGVSPGTVLFELERSNAVKRTKKGIRLVSGTQRHTKDEERVIALSGEMVESLLGSAQENIGAPDPSPNVLLRTRYDNIYQSDVEEIRAWIRSEAKALHKRVRDYLSQRDRDIVERPVEAGHEPPKAGVTVVFGSFSAIEGEADELRDGGTSMNQSESESIAG